MQYALDLVPKCNKCKTTMVYLYDRRMWDDKSYHVFQCIECARYATIAKEVKDGVVKGSKSRKV